MEGLGLLYSGFVHSLTMVNLVACFVGALIGTIVGTLPGLGPTATMALMLPFTLPYGATTGLIMMTGVWYGAMYGGSTTSILVNIPGEAASVVGNALGPRACVRRLAHPALTRPRVWRKERASVAAQPPGSLSAGRAPAPRTRTNVPLGSSAATLRRVAVGARTSSSPASTSAGAPARAAPAGSTGSGADGCGQP